MSIPQAFVQDLLARTDIVEVIGRHVQLKKSGSNYMGLCPFHGEKSPSFSVSPSKQFYHCFGCGANGDAIAFLTEYVGSTFVEAVHDLAQQAGMQVPQEQASPREREQARQQRQHRITLNDVLARAAAFWRTQLRQSPAAIDYLKQRGLSGVIARDFDLGYAPPGWNTLASVFADYNDPLLAESGLVSISGETGRRHDHFRDRIIFPIRNVKGEYIGFGGRVLGNEKPKYINSPETPVFNKGEELYGLFEARAAIRTAGYALVCEGYMDVVALAQLGFANAVATLGTACTGAHIRKLLRFTDNIVFSFDGDAAGRKAAHKAMESALPLASDTRTLKFLFLPPEHDPDSYIRAFGSEAFSRQAGSAMPLSAFLLESARAHCDLATPEGRARMASNARTLWTALPDGALARQLLAEIATLAQLDTRELLDIWHNASRHDRAAQTGEPRRRNAFPQGHLPGERSMRKRPRAPAASRADHAVRLLLSHMDLMGTLTHEDQELLAAQPQPHHSLFVWLEQRLNEYGVQPWAVLRQALQDHPAHDLALQLMDGAAHIQPEDAAIELRDLLDRMLAEHLKQLESEALACLNTDPQAAGRYRQIKERRARLLLRTDDNEAFPGDANRHM